MDFIDDEAEVSSSVLVPSSQPELVSRARKRRRLDPDSDESPVTANDDYDLPTPDDTEGKENKKSKYEDRLHVPAGDHQPDTFVTQLTQQYSSPSRIRGPRWMKPRENPSPSPSPTPVPAASNVSTRLVRPAAPKQMPIISTVPTRPIRPAAPAENDFEIDSGDELEMLAALENDEDELEFLAATSGNTPLDGVVAQTLNANRSNGTLASRQPLQKSTSFRQTTLFGINTTQQEPARTQTQSKAHNWPLANRNEPPTHHEIDQEAMGTWVYPTNLGVIREYQYNIVHKGLFHNILVALPTGLGKTFIAATVMLNWYRWTKSAQIIFVAPPNLLYRSRSMHASTLPESPDLKLQC